jgi:hypothetical protein
VCTGIDILRNGAVWVPVQQGMGQVQKPSRVVLQYGGCWLWSSCSDCMSKKIIPQPCMGNSGNSSSSIMLLFGSVSSCIFVVVMVAAAIYFIPSLHDMFFPPDTPTPKPGNKSSKGGKWMCPVGWNWTGEAGGSGRECTDGKGGYTGTTLMKCPTGKVWKPDGKCCAKDGTNCVPYLPA